MNRAACRPSALTILPNRGCFDFGFNLIVRNRPPTHNGALTSLMNPATYYHADHIITR
jgi:hypothetical protein